MKNLLYAFVLCMLSSSFYKAQTPGPPYYATDEMNIFNYSEFTMGGHVTGSRPGSCYPTLDGHFGDFIYPKDDPLGRDVVQYKKYRYSNLATVPIHEWYMKGSSTATPAVIPANHSSLSGIYGTFTVFTGMIVEYWNDDMSIYNNFAVNTVNTAGPDCDQYPMIYSDTDIDVESFYLGTDYYVVIT